MFGEDLAVTGAAALGEVTVEANVPSIGLAGALTPHLEGEVTVSMRHQGFRLFLEGGGLDAVHDATGSDLTVAAMPTELAEVTATVARPGFEVFQQTIAVVAAFGTLAGTVVDADADQAPVAGARVFGFAQGDDPAGTPLFDLVTAADGGFAVQEELAVGYYDLYVEKFGYLGHEELYFQAYGAADHVVALLQAPAGTLSGVVADADTGTPLAATVRIFRSDTGELYLEAATEPASGAYLAGPLPYFAYELRVTSPGHVPVEDSVTIAEASVTADFALPGTVADVLLLDDNSDLARTAPAKFGPEGNFLAPAYPAEADRAAAEILAALESAGYSVVMENAADSDAASWSQYGMVLLSAGANTGALSSATLRADLAAFRAGGGLLLVEGGEIAYNLNFSDVQFLNTVLHVTSWNGDQSGNLSVEDEDHPVVTEPNAVPATISNTYTGYGDADRVTVADTGDLVCDWTSYDGRASVLVHDDDLDASFGQFVFFTFNYGAMGAGAAELLENAVHYLIGAPQTDTTPVEDRPLPSVLTLLGNHPNPFNPKTIIAFALPADQEVNLAIFDLRGQRVRTLLRGPLAAGHHQAVWLGRDDAGRSVASGTYFYRLSAGGEQRVGKMLLLK
jgi:hypothetical protein